MGRPKMPYKTHRMRVPEPLVDPVSELVKSYKKSSTENAQRILDLALELKAEIKRMNDPTLELEVKIKEMDDLAVELESEIKEMDDLASELETEIGKFTTDRRAKNGRK